ncbi:sulfite exporter TauE/SafE family protein [Colwellia sp. Arc7-635]|uniref:sulfite exporter TauE/SafE family protein n=1 Tax=Colwellia sp. Arc7-635 TaxID=2497879 RepID=UPI000F857394|nr:sulfite exporter TauE/SafE family protein [Colwellia sp. Arc7-635]AZQ83689.1 sulfite exporter TauE/SafE family protein [Colwellia sp. Arc7-635]
MIDLWFILLLIVTGFIAGIINTLAGGGSNLTIPALMVLGMPADVANATNRVGVLLQSCSGIAGFKKHDRLPTHDLPAIIGLTILGGIFGAATALIMSPESLKYVLLGSMIAMAIIMLLAPALIIPEVNTAPNLVSSTRHSWPILFAAGFYGGLIQAGVGFILLLALAGSLRYDLVRANALKLVCTLAFTAASLAIFIYQDLILWQPGLALALGNVVGAWLAVKIAITIEARTMKILILIMTALAAAAVLYFD